MKHGVIQIAAAFMLMLGEVSFAHAGFIGRGLSVNYYYPGPSTPYRSATAVPSTFMVGNGIDTVVNVENVTFIAVDVSDASMLFDFTTQLNSPTWNPASFSGLVFNLVSGGPSGFTAFSIDPSSTFAGFDASRISFNNSQVTVNWQGLSYNSDTMLRIDFTPASAEVLEPATISLLGLGLLGAMAIRRRNVVTHWPATGSRK